MAEEHTKTRKERRLAGFWTGVRSVVAIQSSHHVNHKRLLMHDPQHDNHHHGKGRTSVALANKKALTELQLFHPNGGWKMAWEFVSALAVLYTMLEVPFRIAFVGDVPMRTPLLTLEALVISIFLLDVVLEFNTAYVDTLTNRLVVDRRRIAWRYLTTTFLLDVLSAIPWDVTRTTPTARTHLESIRMLRFIRLVRMSKSFAATRLVRTQLDKWEIDPAIRYT